MWVIWKCLVQLKWKWREPFVLIAFHHLTQYLVKICISRLFKSHKPNIVIFLRHNGRKLLVLRRSPLYLPVNLLNTFTFLTITRISNPFTDSFLTSFGSKWNFKQTLTKNSHEYLIHYSNELFIRKNSCTSQYSSNNIAHLHQFQINFFFTKNK